MRLSPVFSALFVLLLSLPLSAGEARIHGFFVQPELGYGATDFQSFNTQGEWDEWMGSMKDVGAEMLFYQWSVRYQPNNNHAWYTGAYPEAPAPGDYAYYDIADSKIHGVDTWSWVKPTTWPGSPKTGGKEPIDYLLDAAKNKGMKVWLGLYLCEQDFCSWWSANDDDNVIDAADSLAIEHHVLRSIQVAQDLLSKYGDHEGLGGLYYSIEPANIAFMHEQTRPVLAQAIDRVAKAVHTAQPGMKLAICPFFNVALSTPQEYGAMWSYVLAHSDLDILMLQDGVGLEPKILTADNDQVTDWFRELRAAADANGVEFWGNAELFTNLNDSRGNPDLVPGNFPKVKAQLEMMAPFVDKIVSFAFSYLDTSHDIYNFSSEILGATKYADNKQARGELYSDYKNYWETTDWTTSISTPLSADHALLSFRSVPGGAMVQWGGAAERWTLIDVSGRAALAGRIVSGENSLSWGPLAPGRYYWQAGAERRIVNLGE